MQPTWTKDKQLVFISDRSGWWNLYIETSPGSVKALYQKDAEFGEPAWMFGSRSYTILSDGRSGKFLHLHKIPIFMSRRLHSSSAKTYFNASFSDVSISRSNLVPCSVKDPYTELLCISQMLKELLVLNDFCINKDSAQGRKGVACLAVLKRVETFVKMLPFICRILAKYSDPKAAGTTVILLDLETGKHEELALPRPSLGSLSVVEAKGKLLLSTVGGSPKKPSAVIALEVASPEELIKSKPSQWVVLKEASTSQVYTLCSLLLLTFLAARNEASVNIGLR